MKKISSLHRKWMKDPAYRQEYDALKGREPARASVSELFDLGQSKEPTDIAKDKHAKIAEAISEDKNDE